MAEFQLPSPLPESLDEILDLRGKAGELIDSLKEKVADEKSSISAAELADLRQLVADVKALDEAAVSIRTTQEEAAALLAEVAETEVEETEEEVVAEDETEEVETEAEVVAEVEETEAVAEVEETEAVVDEPVEETAEVEEEAVEPELVAASSRKTVSFAGRAAEAPAADAAKPTFGWQIRSDAPGYSATKHAGFQPLGSVIEALGDAQMKGGSIASPNGGTGNEYSSQVIASYSANTVMADDYTSLESAVKDAMEAAKVEDTLYAAGWCAPSETLYDFCSVPPAVELFSLPEISNRRGGLRWPIDPDYTGPFQIFCEPELATAVKECVTIPCPELEEIRLCAVPLCIEADLLQDAAWPELTAYYVELVTQTQRRQRASWILNEVLTHPSNDTLTIPATGQLGAAASLLNSITIAANRVRYGRNLSSNTVIDVVAPYWVRDAIRADIANQGGVPQYAVTNADIQRWFSIRNIAPQFIGHWQTLGDTTDEYPPTVDIFAYERGAFFALTKPVINLGVQYPRELLQINHFTRFFIEDGLAVGKRCGDSILATVPVPANGEIGLRAAVTTPATGTS